MVISVNALILMSAGFFFGFFICVIFIPRFFELTINSEKRVINYLYHEAMQYNIWIVVYCTTLWG